MAIIKPVGFDGQPASDFEMPELTGPQWLEAERHVRAWLAEYKFSGDGARLPNEYLEDECTDNGMYQKMTDILNAAWYESAVDYVALHPGVGTVQDYMEASQGYHDEQVETMNKALELLHGNRT